MSDAVAWFSQFPPISRSLALAACVSSVCFYNGLISPYLFAFLPSLLFTWPPDPRQLLTLFTNFLITGPKLSLVLDPFWLYTWSSALEMDSTKFSTRADYAWYLIFVGGVIHILNYFFIHGGYLLDGLQLALCYTTCQDARGQMRNLFFFNIPAQMMPLALIALAALMNGFASTKLQFAGLVAGHLYDFLTRIFPEFGGGRNMIPTPSWVDWLVATPRFFRRAYGTAVRQPEPPAQGRSTASAAAAAAGAVLPDAWRTRGRGQRLGGG